MSITNKYLDFNKCVTIKHWTDRSEIKCKLGLWSVSGLFGVTLFNEALHYFSQYYTDGEYSKLLKKIKE